MRDLNECRAEVFRRSKKRIIERRQRRKQILTTCIPMVLCVGMLGVYVLSGVLPTADRYSATKIFWEQVDNDSADGYETGLAAGTVEVSGDGISHSYSSDCDVSQIVGLIDEIVTSSDASYDESFRDFYSNDRTVAEIDNAYKGSGYKILIQFSDGECAEYLLQGSVLIDQSTQEKYHMNGSTCNALKAALGIPYYE